MSGIVGKGMVNTTAPEHANDTQDLRQIAALDPSSSLVLPRVATWNGLNLEYHAQPPAECELRSPQHMLCILLSDCETERRMDGGPIQRHHAASGEILIYPALSDHWIRWQQDAEFLLLFLDPALVTRTADELSARHSIELIPSKQATPDPLLNQIGLALKAEMDEGAVAFSSLYAESLASTLSAHLLRHYTVWQPLLPDDKIYRVFPTLRPVFEYIQEHLDQQLTLTELSQLAGISPSHFARSFKEVTGVTPHQYVLNARVERAKALLLQGKLTIAEIASNVGFFDQSHFTRYFKRLTGVTPQTLFKQKDQHGKNLLN
jgi:AraC family transcriptional regulator